MIKEIIMSQQLEFFEIPSPCVGVCSSDEKGFCRGCLRNRDERFQWLSMTDAQKKEVLRLCRQRYLRRQKTQSRQESEIPDQPSLF